MSRCPETMSLGEIADLHGSDKGLVGPSRKWSSNNYVDVYEALFCSLRRDPVIVLEIGIGVRGDRWDAKIVHGRNPEGGASLRMWADYFPKSKVIGLDINDASHLETDRIETFVVDQSKRHQLSAFLDAIGDLDFDIVVDDGSHQAAHQQISLETIWPRLRPGGYYIVEDLNDRGLGEDESNVGSGPLVVSTRRLLRELKRSGEIPRPHAFNDTSFFDQIDEISFYCPRPVLRMRDLVIELLRALLGKGSKGLLRTEYNPASHRMVVLKKSAEGG